MKKENAASTPHSDGKVTLKRKVIIDGKPFLLTSVFASKPVSTPTGKLLALIDLDLERSA